MDYDNKIIDDQKPSLSSLLESPDSYREKGEAVIAIFDIGKTNKKLLLFDENYKIVFEESKQIAETKDEDCFSCDNVNALTEWVKYSFDAITNDERFSVKAVNFSAYGASFVYVGKDGKIIAPLYNYLKPYPENLRKQFYKSYGGESFFAKQTASPVLGNLNSGMQLYRLKYEQPEKFDSIKYALHLPQYVSFILTGKLNTDITCIGCHTNLWDFQNNKYHDWVKKEGMEAKLPPLKNSDEIAGYVNKNIPVGIGLHDSSSALIPYLTSFKESFVLLSTGTWCITLNPFNDTQLSDDELQQDCLSYLAYTGKPVKASRLFAGHEHEQEVKRLSGYFNKPPDYYKTVQFDSQILSKLKTTKNNYPEQAKEAMMKQSVFGTRDLNDFAGYEEAYHQLITDIIIQQVHSSNLVLKGTTVKRIFADGGFSGNPIYMNLLAAAFPAMEVYAATVPQASALGAALVLHRHWNTKSLPADIIELKYYKVNRQSIKY